RLGLDQQAWTGRARLPLRRLYVSPEELGRPVEVADGIVCLPQAMGCLLLRGGVAERGREFKGLPARRNGAIEVSRLPECPRHAGPAPVPARPDRRVPEPGPRPNPTGRGTAYTLLRRAASLP